MDETYNSTGAISTSSTTTPDAEAVAALAEARHAMVHVHNTPGWCGPVTRGTCERYAEQEYGHLRGAGFTLARCSEREALVSIAKRTASMGPCSQTHHEHIAREARAAIEGRP